MVKLEYSVKDRKWFDHIQDSEIEEYVSSIFKQVVKVLGYKILKNKTIELSIVFANDKIIRKINKDFRNCDKSTNVLSFPLYEREFLDVLAKNDYVPIGDIVLAIETIERESEELGIGFRKHLTHMIAHSILHIFGFDHENDEEAEEMQKLEECIMELIGVM
jgi:probable rRNA maturation factor